jgi:hypothetical protein
MASGEAGGCCMWLAVSALISIGLLAAGAADGEPMNLLDARARTVAVRFENSPADAPDRLATTYTVDIPARFEADPESGQVRVRVAGSDVERDYFSRQPLRAGSFSDYVWTFDPRTGHVVSASLRGVLVRRFDLGLFEKEIDTPFEATLSTRGRAGFETARRVFGQLLFPLCERASRHCTLVEPVRYDARTGYVNAVGWIGGRALGISARTFASIGEAVFSEQPARAAGLASAR